MTDKDTNKDLALAVWVIAVNEFIQEAGSVIEKLESQVSSLEGTAKGQKELITSLGERVAALEQINNKSKQAPSLYDTQTSKPAPTYTNCQCHVCTGVARSPLSPNLLRDYMVKQEQVKADPGPGFYYCPSCATRQLIGSVHYCVPAKLYGGFKYESKEVKPGAYEGVHQSVNISATPVKENFSYIKEGQGQCQAAPVVLPRGAAPGPTPPAGGQTEEEIRRAAHPDWTMKF